MSRSLVILGVTGSIGRQALDVAERLGMPVIGMASRTPGRGLVEMAKRHPSALVVATGGSSDERRSMAASLGDRVAFGSDAMVDLARLSDTVVLNAVVGAVGLKATLSAIESGNRLALANKESLVAGGPVVSRALRASSAELIPVDSEHSALFQLLDGRPSETVERLVLTASGGPFRGRGREELSDVTPTEALAHPTWNMGRRITIDSATLANKGLEVIEAHVLFDVPFEKIDVVVHPQSAVHSLVELRDGSLLGHLGVADMRIPIQYALTHPQRLESAAPRFDLTAAPLTFEPPDLDTFRALALAYQAGQEGRSAPAVFNAADEVAVEAFLQGRVGFLTIAEIIERTLDLVPTRPVSSFEEVEAVDSEARQTAASLVAGVC